MGKIRLQKLLANHGYGSRRKIESWIADGLVTVNERVASLGDTADVSDKITINGEIVSLQKHKNSSTKILLYNKPMGEICSTHDPENRSSVYDNLPPLREGRWLGVGRLDINTAGLYIFTNDGDLLNYLIQPSSNIPREYLVKINKNLSTRELDNVISGVIIDGERYSADSIVLTKSLQNNAWYRLTVSRGRNHEVRKLFRSQNALVSKLMRISFAELTLPRNLDKGHYISLSSKEVEIFKLNVFNR